MNYFLGIGGGQEGPVSEADLRQRIAEGRVGPNDICRAETWADGKSVREVFPDAFVVAVPPPLPARVEAELPEQTPRTSLPILPEIPVAPANSRLAESSFTLGLAGLLLGFLAGIPAIVCGHRARREIARSDGRLTGGSMAMLGLVFGYVTSIGSVFLIGVVWLWYAFGPMAQARAERYDEMSRTNLTRISRAAGLYALDHDGRYPEHAEELREILGSLFDEVMDLPHTRATESDGYVLIRGITLESDPGAVVAHEREPRKDGTVAVVRADGIVILVPRGMPLPRETVSWERW